MEYKVLISVWPSPPHPQRTCESSSSVSLSHTQSVRTLRRCSFNANTSPRTIARIVTIPTNQTRAVQSQTPPASVSGRRSPSPPPAAPRPTSPAVAAPAYTPCRTWPDHRWAYSSWRTGNAALRRKRTRHINHTPLHFITISALFFLSRCLHHHPPLPLTSSLRNFSSSSVGDTDHLDGL